MSKDKSFFTKWIVPIQSFFPFLRCHPPLWKSERKHGEKLNSMIYTLKLNISHVYKNPKVSKERVDEVCYKVSTLENQLKTIHSLVQKNFEQESSDLIMRCRNLSELIDCIRDDVFQAYLSLTPAQKAALNCRSKQISLVFSILGILENEVCSVAKRLDSNYAESQIKPLLAPYIIRKSRFAGKVNKLLKDIDRNSDYNLNFCCCQIRETIDKGTDPIEFSKVEAGKTGQGILMRETSTASVGTDFLDSIFYFNLKSAPGKTVHSDTNNSFLSVKGSNSHNTAHDLK